MSGPDFSTRGDRRPHAAIDLLVFAIGAILLALSAYQASSAWAERRAVRLGLEVDRRSAALLSERLNGLDRQAQLSGGSLADQIALTSQASPGRVLADLAELLPADARFDAVTLTYGPRLSVELRVVARSAAAYDRFLERMGGSPLFEAVVPGPETREGEVRAQVQSVYRVRRSP